MTRGLLYWFGKKKTSEKCCGFYAGQFDDSKVQGDQKNDFPKRWAHYIDGGASAYVSLAPC